MQYEILNKTATGVMGDVYKALDTETGRLVTLKTINVTALPRTYTVPDAFQVIGRTCSWPIDTVGVCGSSPHETTITFKVRPGHMGYRTYRLHG